MDWSRCNLVETVPGKYSGAPVLRGTRVPPEAILGNYEAGLSVDEIAENYPTVSREIILGILAYVAENRLQAVS
jgi:uncharacterized protein (DUF433 family)